MANVLWFGRWEGDMLHDMDIVWYPSPDDSVSCTIQTIIMVPLVRVGVVSIKIVVALLSAFIFYFMTRYAQFRFQYAINSLFLIVL